MEDGTSPGSPDMDHSVHQDQTVVFSTLDSPQLTELSPGPLKLDAALVGRRRYTSEDNLRTPPEERRSFSGC